MPRLLTKRKARWVERRKPDFVRGNPLNYPTTIEARFSERINDVVQRMMDKVERDVQRLFTEEHSKEFFATFAQDDTISSQARILTNKLRDKFESIFGAFAALESERMMGQVDKASSTSVHASLEELSGGLSLPTSALSGTDRQVLNASITESTALIKSISTKYLDGVQAATMRSITTGNGLQDLVPYLKKQRGITERRARMIAYDQTRKAFNNLNRGRMQRLGLKKFEWLHTSGSKEPRKLHISYSGKIFSFDDLPIIVEDTGERGIPGQAINCRCRMRPVIEFGEE